MDFLPPDRQLFRPLANLGEALMAAAKAAWPWNTANHIQRRWGLEPSTAENVCKGQASARTVVKAIQAEGDDAWALWDALGEMIIGESREAHDQRVLASISEELNRAKARLETRRAARAALVESAVGLPAVPDRMAAQQVRGGGRPPWTAADADRAGQNAGALTRHQEIGQSPKKNPAGKGGALAQSRATQPEPHHDGNSLV